MEQTLDRAFRLAGERDLAFNHDTRLQGYTFYNDLPRLVQVEATATLGGKTVPLPSLDPDNDNGLMLPQQYEPGFVRPDALSLVLTFKTPRTTYQRTINTDLVMAGPMPEYTQPSDNWLLTKESKLSTNEIARYLTASYLLFPECLLVFKRLQAAHLEFLFQPPEFHLAVVPPSQRSDVHRRRIPR